MPYEGNKKNEYQTEWLQKRRQNWIDENGPCVQCGSDVDLEIDHKDPRLKTMNPARIWSLAEDNPRRIRELNNCQVLCHDCHRKKTNAQLVVEHGIRAYNSRGCRCEICKKAISDYKREYRARLKKNKS